MMEKGVSVLCFKRHVVPQSTIPGESRKMGSADSKDPIRNRSNLFDLFPVPSIILSPESNTIQDSNQAFSELTGLSTNDPLPTSVLRSIKTATSRILETGEPFSSIGVNLPDQTGRQISLEVDCRPIVNNGKACFLLTFRERQTVTRRSSILHLVEEAEKDFRDRKEPDLFFTHLQRALGTIFPIHFSILSIPSPDGSLKTSGISGKDQGDPDLLLSYFRSFRWNTPDGLKSAIGKAIDSGKIQIETPDMEKGPSLSDLLQKMGIKTTLTIPFGTGEEGDLPFGLLTIGLEKSEEADQTFLKDLEILSSAIADCLNRNSLHTHVFGRSRLFDLAPDGILLVDPTTCQVMDFNRTFRKMVGTPPDHSPWDLSRFLKRSGETLQEILQTSGQSGFSSTVEPLTRFDGTRFFADLTGTVIHDRNKPYLLLHVRDITSDYETKGINALLVEIDRMILKGDPPENLLSLIVDRLSGLFGFACTLFMLPVEGGEFNLLQIAGESPAIHEFILKSFSGLRWNTPPGIRTLVGKAFIEKRPIYVEIDEYEINWGSPIGNTARDLGIAAGFAVPIQKGNNQSPWGVLSIVVKKPEELSEKIREQITDLAGRIEIAFAQLEEHRIEIQKKAIFDEAPDGIFLLDPERLLLLESNKVFFNMLGVSDQKALVGKHIKEFLVSSEQDFSLLSELLVGYSGHSSLFRSRIRRSDGTIFTTSTSVSLIPYGDKKALTVHIRDITQEILIEGMNRLWAELDQRILLGDPLDNLISFIVRKIQDLFGFHWTCFVTPQPDGSFRVIEIASNHPGIDEKIRGFLAPLKWNTQPGNRTLLGRALTSGVPQVYDASSPQTPIVQEWIKNNHIEGMISLPVTRQSGNQIIGGLTVAVQKKANLSDGVVSLLKDLSLKIRNTFSRFEEQNLIRIQQASMEAAKNPMWITNPKGEVEWANNEFFRMLGSDRVPAKEISIGSIFSDPISTTSGAKSLLQIIRSGKPFEGEVSGISQSGGRIFTQTLITPLKDHRGKIAHILGHQKDVTIEREEMEIDQLLAKLDANVLNGINFQGLLDLLTSGVQSIYDALAVQIATLDETHKLSIRSFVSKDPKLSAAIRLSGNAPDVEGFKKETSHLASRKDRHQEIRLKDSPDEYPFRNLLLASGCETIHSFPIHEKGKAVGALTLFLDRTSNIGSRSIAFINQLLSRISIVLERFSEQERMRLQDAAMANVSNGIMITSADGTIGWVNPALVSMSGYSEKELIGTNAWLTTYGNGHPEIHEALLRTVREGRPFEGVLDAFKKDQTPYTVEISITPIQNSEGKITHFVAIQKDQTLKIQQEREIWQLAHIDALTGLLNRPALLDRLRTETERSARSQKSLALLFIDLDGFKEVNDTFGHAAGDILLKTVAQRISRTLRSTDAASRLGGDEFVLLITDLVEIDEILFLIQRIFDAILEPILIEDQPIRITASMGVATFPEDASDAGDLLRKSDIAMYQAKSHNKNNWQFFDPEMEKRVQRRHSQAKAIINGLEKGEFTLYYMPAVDLQKGLVTEIEALLRWNSPEDGLLLPDVFLPTAEESGLMTALGEWTIERAIETIHHWLEDGRPPVRLSINISPTHFWSPGFTESFLRRIKRDPAIATWLTVELTESLLMKNLEKSLEFLEAIREFGVRISVDDFGLGSALLPNLPELHVDEIKIPQAYVLHMERHNRTRQLVKTIIHLGENMGIDVVGEGVETGAEKKRLLEMGCHVLQGFEICRPVPLPALEDFLKRFQ